MTSITSSFRNLNELYQTFGDTGSYSGSVVDSSLSTTITEVKPVINWNDFSKHIFFDKAIYKVNAAIEKVKREYIVGISGSSTASLSSTDVAAYDVFMNEANDFEKYVLKYLGGATSEVNAANPSVTSNVVASGGNRTVIIINRDSNNNFKSPHDTFITQLRTRAADFDSGKNLVEKFSGTANEEFIYSTSGIDISALIMPTQIIERVNRSSELSELIPDAYFYNDEEELLNKYLAIIGRFFDQIKLYIDEFTSLYKITYNKYSTSPESLFQVLLAKQFGLSLIETALNEKINIYLRSINNKLPAYKVTSKILNRILNNAIYLLKTKGTKESINSIIRIFGLPSNYLNVSDYSNFQEARIVKREEYKNIYVLRNPSVSGRIDFIPSLSSYFKFDNDFTVETRISLSANYSPSLSGIFLWYGSSTSGYSLAYKNGIITFRVNNTFVSTPSISSNEIIKAITGGDFINIFGIRNSSSGIIYAMWTDDSSGSALLKSTSAATSVNSTTISGVAGSLSAFIGSDINATSGFNGYIHEIKGYNISLSVADMEEHTRNFESISVANTSGTSISSLRFHFKLKENKTLSGTSNYIIDSSNNSVTGFASQTLSATKPYKMIESMKKETQRITFGGFADDTEYFAYNNLQNKAALVSTNAVSISFNPIEAIDNDIVNVFGKFNLVNLISNPANFIPSASAYTDYPDIQASASLVFNRYNNQKFNLNAYIKAIENFSPVINGIIQLSKQLIPARSNLIANGIVIEPHMLDRNRNKQGNITQSEIGLTTNTVNQNLWTCSLSYDIPNTTSFYSETSTVISTVINGDDRSYTGSATGITSTIQTSDAQSTTDTTNVSMSHVAATGLYNITNATTNSSWALVDTASYIKMPRDIVTVIASSAYQHTLSLPVSTNLVDVTYPYTQEVADPENVSILFTTNKNMLETNSTLYQTDRFNITGNIKLIRTKTGKAIKSAVKTVRLEFPFMPDNANTFINFSYSNTSTTANTLDLMFASKNGIDFTFNSIYSNMFLGIKNIRVVNLLNGRTQEFPVIVVNTANDAKKMTPGQLIIESGKTIV